LNDTVPEPVLSDEMTLMNASLAVVDQVQVALLIVTPMVVEPPLAVSGTDWVDSVAMHPVAWLMVTVCPATVREPLQAGPSFASAV